MIMRNIINEKRENDIKEEEEIDDILDNIEILNLNEDKLIMKMIIKKNIYLY